MGAFLVPVGVQATYNIQGLATAFYPFNSLIQLSDQWFSPLGTSSHSPPGLSTGRLVCQKLSLLRI